MLIYYDLLRKKKIFDLVTLVNTQDITVIIKCKMRPHKNLHRPHCVVLSVLSSRAGRIEDIRVTIVPDPGAPLAWRALKPDKKLYNTATRCRVLFCKIQVRPWSYPLWRPCDPSNDLLFLQIPSPHKKNPSAGPVTYNI